MKYLKTETLLFQQDYHPSRVFIDTTHDNIQTFLDAYINRLTHSSVIRRITYQHKNVLVPKERDCYFQIYTTINIFEAHIILTDIQDKLIIGRFNSTKKYNLTDEISNK